MSMTRKKKRGGSRLKGKLPDSMQGCLDILKNLQSRQEAGPFLEPVDWKRFDLPNYPLIIKRPMDLGTIERRIFDSFYATSDEFAEDVRLVWANAQKYNRPESDIYRMSEALSKVFDKKYGKLSKLYTKKSRKKSQHQREIGRKDRLKFKDLMTKLSGEQLSALVGNLREQCPGALSKDAEAVEVQIDRIDSATLLDQLQFCRECVKRNRQGTAYSVPASKRLKHR
mmetsp:Transcript_35099/g.49104  ORF Transcript_35099/g.49104 Transcript_35099/m.49104 type:complete len:226 (-) Transcript_35099:101-778(-)